MNVKVSDFRNSVDHLFRIANVDYHACVGARELRYWVIRAENVIVEVKGLECNRTTENDRERHTKSLAAASFMLEQATDRIGKLETEKN